MFCGIAPTCDRDVAIRFALDCDGKIEARALAIDPGRDGRIAHAEFGREIPLGLIDGFEVLCEMVHGGTLRLVANFFKP